MLTNWKIFNFKSIGKETDLPLSPLTVLAGANSCGKSTVLQSMLLVAQTLRNKLWDRPIILNGELCQLGQFDDLKTVGSDADQILIGWTSELTEDSPLARETRFRSAYVPGQYTRPTEVKRVECEVSFDIAAGHGTELAQLQPVLFGTQIRVTSLDKDQVEVFSDLYMSRATPDIALGVKRHDVIGDVGQGWTYEVTLDDESWGDITSHYPSAAILNCDLNHFMPEMLELSVNPVDNLGRSIHRFSRQYFRRKIGGGAEIHFPKSAIKKFAGHLAQFSRESIDSASITDWFEKIPDDGLSLSELIENMEGLSENIEYYYPKILSELAVVDDVLLDELRNANEGSRELHLQQLPDQLSIGISYTKRVFNKAFKYLGPLRDAPKPLYPLVASADPTDVGLRGEHTAAVLDVNKSRRVQFVPTSGFSNPVIDQQLSNRSLIAAVKDWANYLGVAETIQSHDKGKLGHELKVTISDSTGEHDLTHVGVGVSQVLPILVMGLLAERDSTLVFEQPELHLHPRVQTLLGDFFLSLALMGKQCIVETHSEYLINRVRFRTAAAKPEQSLVDKTRIYFGERRDGRSHFREVKVNEYGAITDWPVGFFDQTQSEAEEILRAASAKRRTMKEKKNADR